MLIIDGKRYGVPGLAGSSFKELPQLGLASRKDWRPRPRDKWIRGIVVHTRMGLPVKLKAGGKHLGWDEVLARRFSDDDRQASCHIAIDGDGSYACLADLRNVVTYHAEHVNEITVGIEMYQGTDGIVYDATLDACVLICDVLTRVLGIQRQFPLETGICRRLAVPTVGVSPKTKAAFIHGGARGLDFVGVYGHRNVTRNRGRGDPDDQIFERLEAAGYEGYNIDAGDDLDVWAARQQGLGMPPEECLGIPDRRTREMLAMARGLRHGVWVQRPGDEVADRESEPGA